MATSKVDAAPCVEEFSLDGAAGRPIRGDLRTVPGAAHGVVLCHGFKGFGRWGFFPYLADSLAAAGLSVVSFDFTGSGIGPDREHFTEAEAFANDTYGNQLHDLDIVLRTGSDRGWLGSSPRPGLFGFSRGGGVAILRAASDREPEIGALVTWSSIADVNRWSDAERADWRARGYREAVNTRTGEVSRVGLPFLDEVERLGATTLNIRDAAQRIGERALPWLIVHGTADETVPVHEGRQLHTASSDRAELLLVERASHTYNAKHGMTEPTPELSAAVDRTVRFFAANLA